MSQFLSKTLNHILAVRFTIFMMLLKEEQLGEGASPP